MISHFKPWCALLGLLLAMLFAANVAAYPVDNSDGSTDADVGDGLGAPAASRRADARDVNSVGFADALLREGRDSPYSLFADGQPGEDTSAFAGQGEPNPLARALRSVVNVNAQRNAVWSPSSSSPSGQADESAGSEIGEDLSAALLKLETSLAGVVTRALDARIDDQGRVTFSVAGVEGFHVTAGGGEVSLGHGGASVVVSRQAPVPLERRFSTLDASSGQPGEARRGKSPTQEFFDIVFEIFQYPLTWLVIFLLLLGQVALLIARFRNRRRSHRKHSRGTQPTEKRRTRHRIRIKHRVRSSAEPLQP